MKRVAIVSSYAEECGAAYYSSRLLKHLEAEGYEVAIKRLPVSLLRISAPTFIRRKGDQEIERICREIAEYDSVFLQFEPGLYGTRPKISYRRVQRLLAAAKNAVVTVHGFDKQLTGRSPTRMGKLFFSGRPLTAAVELLEGGVDPIADRFWEFVRRSPHIKVLTFNHGDQVLLQRFFDLPKITNYPICYFDQQEVQEIKATVDRDQLLRDYGLDPAFKYFGVCGFFAPYKGHLTAMKALEFLPEDWRLLIVGGEHPQAIEPDVDIGAYVRQLMAFAIESDKPVSQDGNMSVVPRRNGNIIGHGDLLNRIDIREKLFRRSEFKYFFPSDEIKHRIHYAGQVTDEEMPKFYAGLDYVVHPYMKTKSGQSGSGPATFAVEFGSRALFTNAPVFREMGVYFEGALRFFNIGNFHELADSLKRFDNFEGELTRRREAALKIYNPKGMVDTYRRLLES